MIQSTIEFSVHQRENNAESQDHLDINREHFSAQCKRVYDYLMNGGRLTVYSAMVDLRISSAPRRILDLKEKGVKISDRWVGEKETNKEWFMSTEDKMDNKKNVK